MQLGGLRSVFWIKIVVCVWPLMVSVYYSLIRILLHSGLLCPDKIDGILDDQEHICYLRVTWWFFDVIDPLVHAVLMCAVLPFLLFVRWREASSFETPPAQLILHWHHPKSDQCPYYSVCLRTEVLTSVTMKIVVFWHMMLHRLVKSTDVQRILLPSISILMLEVVGSPETSVHF